MISMPVSAGELIDRLSILMIKQKRITDPLKLANINAEYNLIKAISTANINITTQLAVLIDNLLTANETIWDAEDTIRECERNRDFGDLFKECARCIYHTNDLRAKLKREINLMTGSEIIEEKSYAPYAKGENFSKINMTLHRIQRSSHEEINRNG